MNRFTAIADIVKGEHSRGMAVSQCAARWSGRQSPLRSLQVERLRIGYCAASSCEPEWLMSEGSTMPADCFSVLPCDFSLNRQTACEL